jgi:hypothetical protein
MKTVHTDLNISEVEFAAVADNLAKVLDAIKKVLDAIKVAEPEKNELVGLIIPMRGDIVGELTGRRFDVDRYDLTSGRLCISQRI